MKKNIKYWLKAGFNIVRRLNPSDSKQTDSYGISSDVNNSDRMESTQVAIQPKDYVSYVSYVVSQIIDNLDNLIQFSSIITLEYVLEVYISDNLLYEYCVNQGFIKLLKEKMYMDRSYTFGKCLLFSITPEETINVTVVAKGVSIRLNKKSVLSKSACAKISVLDNWGSLLDEPVLLDGNHLPAGRANIGVGRHARLDNGSIRINTIAIDDSIESPQYDRNKFVSRSHANVQFRNGRFMLFVEASGTSLAGKRTTISRTGKSIKLDVPDMGIILENRDQIVLTKSVVLLFEEID